VGDLRRPHDPTCLLVERDKLAVELTDVDLAVAEPDPAARPAAADRLDLLIEMRAVCPHLGAGLGVDREHVVGAGDDVHHVPVHDRLRFAGVLAGDARAKMDVPQALQPRDVSSVDLVERRVTLIRGRAAVRDPVRRRQAGELVRREGRRSTGRVAAGATTGGGE
jgi:hypothetical protein